MATTKKSAAKKSPNTTSRTPRAGVTARSASGKTADADGGTAKTIVFIHGIGNKPLPKILKCQWDEALFGFNLGERSRLAYWVNRLFYPIPEKGTCKSPDITLDGETPNAGSSGGMSVRSIADPSFGMEPLLPEAAESKMERAVMTRLAKELLDATGEPRGSVSAADYRTRVLPLPKPLREFITRRITKAFLKDVHEYLFDEARRRAMRESLLTRLRTGGGPFVVIAHSQGSMIAYDALCGLDPAEYDIPLFVTIGSPLGLTEVQDRLKTFTNQNRLAVPAVVKRWINVADPLDPVCADKKLASDYKANGSVAVEDVMTWNADSPRSPHSGTGYLKLSVVRKTVLETIQRDLFQAIAPFTIARDLVSRMEDAEPEERHPVLIELRDETGGATRPVDEVRSDVVEWITKTAKASKLTPDDIELEALSSYVSARLSRSEVERLSEDLHMESVYRVFQNARKRALLDQSVNVLQCATAHRGYDARGQDITWAVLDSGIDPEHPHFGLNSNIDRVYDCMPRGRVVEWDPEKAQEAGHDRNGHGTHVAGIIGGELVRDDFQVRGIAPAVKLRSYKVLNDDGEGDDAKIIKALDHIYEVNNNASSLVIHGVNLSLGGPFDPEVFGCGDTPICKQLRKLWRQGVLVVLAAGNEGYLELEQSGQTYGLSVDLSIGDPANLDEAIAVGSISKSKPHLYGVSYFSSRGPTADGRCKPDLVAPGEKILSCRAGARRMAKDALYVGMSGTSMAAPHISGLLACFLSIRREFIGYPERVKQLLLASCTDLQRDRNHQGAGMPNLVKMLLDS